MKIIQITPDYPPNCGGIGYYVFYLCKELQKRGHDVEVLYRGKKNRKYSFEGIFVEEIKIPGYPPFNMPLFRNALERRLAKIKADIVHIHSSVMPVLTISAPLVVTGHCCNSEFVPICYRPIRGLEEFYRNITLKFYSMIEGKLATSCDGMTVVSKALKEQYLKYYDVTAKVIYNAVDPHIFSSIPETSKAKNVLFTGRLSQGKGLSHILDVASMLKESHPDAVVQIIGSGPLSRYMEHERKKRNLTNVNIVAHLPHHELIRHYQQAKLFFLPTFYEGFANSVLEAMSCRLPVVASNIPSLREQIIDGTNGYLVSQGDSKMFHERISNLLNDDEMCRNMGNAGRRMIIDNFTWKHVGDLVEDQYKELIGGL